jgi:hypothetical protein
VRLIAVGGSPHGVTPRDLPTCSTQVSLIHESNLPTILSPTTTRRSEIGRFGFISTSDLPPRPHLRRSHPLSRVPLGVTWASPMPSRLATTTGRIEFVILRTGCSPPAALHPASWRRSCSRLQSSNRALTGTSTLRVQFTHKRTSPHFPNARPAGLAAVERRTGGCRRRWPN